MLSGIYIFWGGGVGLGWSLVLGPLAPSPPTSTPCATFCNQSMNPRPLHVRRPLVYTNDENRSSSSFSGPPTDPRTVPRGVKVLRLPQLAAAATTTARSAAAAARVPAVRNRGIVPPNAVPQASPSLCPAPQAAEVAGMVETRTSSVTSATFLCR